MICMHMCKSVEEKQYETSAKKCTFGHYRIFYTPHYICLKKQKKLMNENEKIKFP